MFGSNSSSPLKRFAFHRHTATLDSHGTRDRIAINDDPVFSRGASLKLLLYPYFQNGALLIAA